MAHKLEAERTNYLTTEPFFLSQTNDRLLLLLLLLLSADNVDLDTTNPVFGVGATLLKRARQKEREEGGNKFLLLTCIKRLSRKSGFVWRRSTSV